MGASALKLPCIVDPATLEAIACREGPALAADLNIKHQLITTDCKQLVEDIKSGTGGLHLHGIIIKVIQSCLHHFISCSFIYESRSSNFEAHSLAKLALGLEGRHLWLLQPLDLNCIPLNIVLNQ